jgi:N utilization substance protein B
VAIAGRAGGSDEEETEVKTCEGQIRKGAALMARAGGINPASMRRAVARKLAMQALYRWQLNATPWQDVVNEFAADEDMRKADRGYFNQLVTEICGGSEALDIALSGWMDRKPTELDPVERAVLWVGAHELKSAPDVPYRVVINEAVGLAKRFGATDSHKFVNAVLDAAAKELRPHEH